MDSINNNYLEEVPLLKISSKLQDDTCIIDISVR